MHIFMVERAEFMPMLIKFSDIVRGKLFAIRKLRRYE